jgi:hypothetical protein
VLRPAHLRFTCEGGLGRRMKKKGKEGKRNGKGTYTFIDGKTKIGLWKDDNFVK